MNVYDAMNAEFEQRLPDIKRVTGAVQVTLSRCGDEYSLVADGNKIAGFGLAGMYGCSGLGIFYHSIIAERYRGKGLGQILHTVRLTAAKSAGFGAVQCTTRADNPNQVHILEKNGWTRTGQFYNPKTGNTVLVWLKNL